MITKTTLYYNDNIFCIRIWSTKKAALKYKKGILQGFTVSEKVRNNINITLDKLI